MFQAILRPAWVLLAYCFGSAHNPRAQKKRNLSMRPVTFGRVDPNSRKYGLITGLDIKHFNVGPPGIKDRYTSTRNLPSHGRMWMSGKGSIGQNYDFYLIEPAGPGENYELTFCI